MNELKGIIFDFDGVIVSSEYPTFVLLQKILKQYHFQLDNASYPKRVGKRIRDFLPEITEGHLTPHVQHEVLEIFYQEYINNTEKYVEPIPATTNFIKTYNGDLQIGLASLSNRIVIENILHVLNLRSFFNCIVSFDDVTYPKPHPETYQKTVKRLQLSPESCMAIEDSLIGIQSAIQAGLQPYIFLNGVNKKEDFTNVSIRGFIKSEKDISKVIQPTLS